MTKLSLALFVAGLSATAAFQVRSPQHVMMASSHILHSVAELSPIDEMSIENVAEFCLDGSCDIEEYEALLNQLEEQKTHFIKHVATVELLLSRLKDSNHPEHDPDDVRVLIDNIKDTLSNRPKVEEVASSSPELTQAQRIFFGVE